MSTLPSSVLYVEKQKTKNKEKNIDLERAEGFPRLPDPLYLGQIQHGLSFPISPPDAREIPSSL